MIKKKSVIQVSEKYKDKISLAISGLHKSQKETFLKENKESQVLKYYQKSVQVGSQHL